MDELSSNELECIHRFLLSHKFETTAGALMTEAARRGIKSFENSSSLGPREFEEIRERIVTSYRTGDWRTFFKLWDTAIPEHLRQRKECKILELNLRVHFAVLPKRQLSHGYKNEKSSEDSMEQLRDYLNAEGKELESETQLRAFFALPFIEDLRAEPFLSRVFEQDWLDRLTEDLLEFLDNHKEIVRTLDGKESVESLIIRHSSSRELKRKNVVKNRRIIPNDRNIPLFFEDYEVTEEFHSANQFRYNQRSKSTQTPVGDYLNNVHGDDNINSPGTVRNDKRLIQYTKELALTKSHLCTVHSNYEKLKLRFHKLHADYHKLISVAGELTAALESSVKGQCVDLQAMLETCIKIFPDLFNQNIRDGTKASSMLQLTKSQADGKADGRFVSSVSPKLLDFKKIKLHLINGNVKTKLLLLQALRRKITLGQPGERDEAIHEYITKDLLGLHGQIASDNGKSILPYLLVPDNMIMPHPLQQSAARLLNVLASFRCGRDYLSFGSTVVGVIFKCLCNVCDSEADAFTCNMMIATLQKLSLRKQQRLYMIEAGLVEWLIHHLHDECQVMGPYRLEYATALLMNLSLHRLAQRRASAVAPLLITTLITLLSIDHASALPYVNGTLNNFLSNPVINEEAKRIKLSTVLEDYRKQKTGEIRNHLDYILKKHKGENSNPVEDEETADDDNEEFDVLENELEENDPVKNYAGELNGEALLATCYTVSPSAIHEKSVVSDVASLKQCKMHTPQLSENQSSAMHNEHRALPSNKSNFAREDSRKSKITGREGSLENIGLRLRLFEDPGGRELSGENYDCRSDHERDSTRPMNLVASDRGEVRRRKSNPRVREETRRRSAVCDNPTGGEHYRRFISGKLGQPNVKSRMSGELGDSFSSLNFRASTNPGQSRKTSGRPRNPLQRGTRVLNVGGKFSDESAVYLYENQTSKESSMTTVGSTLVADGRESGPTDIEQLSSIASLGVTASNDNFLNNASWKEDVNSEEAFLAKPKLSRTPT